MEPFIKTIQSLYDEIQQQKKEDKPSLLINSIVIQKQYLVYYIYRIICTNYEYFRLIALGTHIKNLNTKLEILSNYKFVCYPLANRMTNDEIKLDDIFQEMVKMLNNAIKKSKEVDHPNQELETFLTKKTHNQIIKDIKKLIEFVPNLSKYKYYG